MNTDAKVTDIAAVPPVCSGEELQRAFGLLKRVRKQLAESPEPLRRWVVGCLAKDMEPQK